MSKRVVRVLAVVFALTALAAAGVAVAVRLGGDDDPAGAPAAARVTSLDGLAASTPVVARAAFCDGLSAARVTAALGGRADDAEAYDNGDTVALGAGTPDVAHEYGCSWTGADLSTVRAWVFAPPVTPARAKRLARLAERGAGCTPYSSAGSGYGDPSTAYTCSAGDQLVAGRAGLFGDAWLSCTLTVPAAGADPAAVQARTDRWCVDVALAAARGTA